ncbi:hypothetical protein VNO80_29676 [Phaseolus coccineus]|uniref:Exportin-5 C-terminal domain-containing protein n=1 Tax=Phaseolus coccineus TaxID=3886 RepID=A0AAN9LEU3_PHACN
MTAPPWVFQRHAVLLIKAWSLPRWTGIGRALTPSFFRVSALSRKRGLWPIARGIDPWHTGEDETGSCALWICIDLLVKLVDCSINNDPFTSSPTETLVQLFLPLNDKTPSRESNPNSSSPISTMIDHYHTIKKSSTHSAANSAADSSTSFGEVENAKKKSLSFVGDDYCLVSIYSTILRWFVSSYKPVIAATKVSEKFDKVIEGFLVSPAPTQDLAVMESMQLAIEGVVNAVFDGSNDFTKTNPEVQFALCRTFEGILQRLISLKWTEPALLEDTSMHSARHARLQNCTSFIRISKAADKKHLTSYEGLSEKRFVRYLYTIQIMFKILTQGIADTMACSQREGCLLQSEHNLLGEAFLVMAYSGIQQQQEALKWLLEPLSHHWTQSEWQDKYLSEEWIEESQLDVHSVSVALMENIQSMEFRHIRQLVHFTLIPLDMWEVWLEKILHPLFIRAQQALSCSWSSLLQDGRAKVPDVLSILSGSDLKVEVMEETILRDLTREIYSLRSVIASPPLNNGIPSLEQSGHVSRLDTLKSLDTVALCSIVGFLLKHEGLALPTLRLCLEAFTWTDGESVTKISSYCSVLVVLAIVTNLTELIEYVCRDLFTSIIQGLTLESNAITSADLVSICREIFLYLCDRHPALRQVSIFLVFHHLEIFSPFDCIWHLEFICKEEDAKTLAIE